MKFVNCPHCGHKLLEGENGSSVNVKCSKCKSVVNVILDADGTVHLSVVLSNKATKEVAAS